METVLEEARSIPVAGEFDICVVGGRCTGVFAAVRAAQLGARVAIVEANAYFGGVATAGLVNVWHSIYNTSGEQQIIAGLTTEMIERLLKRDAATLRTRKDPDVYATMATAEMIMELDRLVLEYKVRPFLHTWFSAPLVKDGRLAAVAVDDKSGRRAIKASYFIDATGDGDVARRMRPPTNRDHLQPPTLCAIIAVSMRQQKPIPTSRAQGGLRSALSECPHTGDALACAGARTAG